MDENKKDGKTQGDRSDASSERAKERLDSYLKQIEGALQGISVSDRCDILMELNSHITESMERNGQNVEKVIEALGDPIQVANRYLLSRGIDPVPPKKKPVLRWALIGAAGVFLLFIISTVLVIKSFFPIIDLNENEGKVKILGGLIDINEKEGKFSIGKGALRINADDIDLNINFNSEVHRVDGEISVPSLKEFYSSATNGKFDYQLSDSSSVEYRCKIKVDQSESLTPEQIEKRDFVKKSKNRIAFDFGLEYPGVSCKFKVPREVKIEAELTNGKVSLDKLDQPVSVEVTNGKIDFDRDSRVKYAIRPHVTRGVISGFRAGKFDGAGHKIDLRVMNGTIGID